MKLSFDLKAIPLIALSLACVFLAACGAGSNVPPPPVVSVAKTQNPLVAQFSVSMACSGQAMVEFGPDTTYGRSTSWTPIPAGYISTPILVAGMRASTTYHMRAQAQCLGNIATSQDLTFTTGPLPSIAFPNITVTRPNPSLSSSESPGIEYIDVTVANTPAYFTDRDANPIWYYDVTPGNFAFPFKLLPNGHMLLSVTPIITGAGSFLREVDLAGNTIREMTINQFAAKVQNAGYDFVPGGFHHDFVPLDNGHVIVIVDCGKNFDNLPGYPGTTFVVGDAVVDLDQNWNPVWAWNAFDYLDINRHVDGLPDWTHSNALVYSPDDGNLILSMRNQSWILKIDYNNGAGTGNILWRLGYQGDFALTDGGVPNDDPSVWFANQHFPVILSQSGPQTTLAIWDNGDNRVLNTNGELCINPVTGNSYPACYSRPSIFQVDEGAMVANVLWADPLQYFGVWGGSINQLANGNVEFDLNAPAIAPAPNVGSQVQEVTQTPNPQVIWQMDMSAPSFAYRAYRVPSLYNGVTWQY
jgi:hypothetical protein